MELLGIDFAGPFPNSEGTDDKYLLVAVDYFSRYVWAEPTRRNDSETVIKFLKTSNLDKIGAPVGMYMDPGPHSGDKTRKFAEKEGIMWCNSPVAAKKAAGMVEKSVDLVQRVLKKISDGSRSWAEYVPRAVMGVNRREIPHLLYSPAQILFGFNPVSSLELKLPLQHGEALAAGLSGMTEMIDLDEEEHRNRVVDYVKNRANTQRIALERSDHAKIRASERHDLGIRGTVRYDPGDLVMLYDHRQAGKKLRPSWRGPFVITGFGGDMGKSCTIRQINGTPIPRRVGWWCGTPSGPFSQVESG
ncbi:hypothetical protein K3495_g1530 [Podosphaera aphanis]|nr:hypothetical protein K3495_g1530 [Podosphaera aphanis]